MATGTELFLGVVGKPAIDELAQQLGLVVDWGYDNDHQGPWEQIDTDLEKEWVACMGSLPGFVVKAKGGPRGGRYYMVDTPAGEREMCPWGFSLYYDPHEMGEGPEHAVLGVSLITRYFPTFLDWQGEHGGSGDAISLTPETLKMIELARTYISRVIPQIADAPISVKEMFY